MGYALANRQVEIVGIIGQWLACKGAMVKQLAKCPVHTMDAVRACTNLKLKNALS